ncbi:MAG: hypothetical protein ABSB01_22055 [Streptosporangiaceae bacterium]
MFVIVDPASTAKLAAVPSGTGGVAALAADWIPTSAAAATAAAKVRTSQQNRGAMPVPRVEAAFT